MSCVTPFLDIKKLLFIIVHQKIFAMEIKDWKIFFSYNQDQRWVAKGQSVVAYLGDECLGGGIIE